MPDDFDFSKTRPTGQQAPPAAAPGVAPAADFDFSQTKPVGEKPAGPRPWYQPVEDFTGGAVQGAIFDPVTGINQLLEHFSNNKIGLSESSKKELEDFRDKYTGQDKTAGNFGRFAGEVGSVFLPWGAVEKGVEAGEAMRRAKDSVRAVGKATGVSALETKALAAEAGRAAEAAARKQAKAVTRKRFAQGAAVGATGAAVQPLKNDKDMSFSEFNKQKATQGALGMILGGAAGAPFAPYVLSTGAIMAAANKFGIGPTAEAIVLLSPALGTLAARHYGTVRAAAKSIEGGVEKVVQRPGTEYAIGRESDLVPPRTGARLLFGSEK